MTLTRARQFERKNCIWPEWLSRDNARDVPPVERLAESVYERLMNPHHSAVAGPLYRVLVREVTRQVQERLLP